MTQPLWRPAGRHAPGDDGDELSLHGRAEDRWSSAQPGRPARRWGALPVSAGVCLVIGSAAAGAVITVATHHPPGALLGLFVVAGTVLAALVVWPGSAYVIIPVPALALVTAALGAGLASDRAAGSSRTALAIGAAQWVASGFVAMSAATGIAVVITVTRWLLYRQARRGSRHAAGR